MTAHFCLKNFGSSSCPLRDLVTRKIYSLTFKYDYSIVCSYIPSKQNLSDMPSRKFKGASVHTEWMLHSKDFRQVLRLCNFDPDIDLFASNQNKQLPKFASWSPHVDASYMDCFSLDWCNIRGIFTSPIFNCLQCTQEMHG